MSRPGIARLAALTLLFTLVTAVLFSSYVLVVSSRAQPAGPVGRAALALASFPALVSQAWTETLDRFSGRESYKYLAVPRPDADLTGFAPVPAAEGVQPVRLLMKGDTDAARRGWRLFGGAFALADGVRNALVLIGPDFRIRRVWPVHEDGIALSRRADQARKIVHGLATLDDGDVVVSLDNGSAVQRYDLCGERVWAEEGLYHHAVTADPATGTLWTLRIDGFPPFDAPAAEFSAPATGFVRLDAETGEVVDQFAIGDLILANRDSGIFTTAFRDHNLERTNETVFSGQWTPDAFHFNDVEPLPRSLAPAFPAFEAGDLLVSSRALNAILVIDPDTRKVKWHRFGATLRQHDPDWQPDGTISIYDNRMSRGPSRIVSIDPESMTREVLYDGARHDFYSRIRGRHMLTPHGALLFTSPQQGRALELDAKNRPLLEFYNPGPDGTGLNLVVTEYHWLPEDALTLKEDTCSST